jgi:hypothetical protein
MRTPDSAMFASALSRVLEKSDGAPRVTILGIPEIRP